MCLLSQLLSVSVIGQMWATRGWKLPSAGHSVLSHDPLAEGRQERPPALASLLQRLLADAASGSWNGSRTGLAEAQWGVITAWWWHGTGARAGAAAAASKLPSRPSVLPITSLHPRVSGVIPGFSGQESIPSGGFDCPWLWLLVTAPSLSDKPCRPRAQEKGHIHGGLASSSVPT